MALLLWEFIVCVEKLNKCSKTGLKCYKVWSQVKKNLVGGGDGVGSWVSCI